MATITINVSDEVTQVFRKHVYHMFGKKKGVLGKAMSEAMRDWSTRQEYLETCMKLLKTGKDMGKLLYKKREELHDRN